MPIFLFFLFFFSAPSFAQSQESRARYSVTKIQNTDGSETLLDDGAMEVVLYTEDRDEQLYMLHNWVDEQFLIDGVLYLDSLKEELYEGSLFVKHYYRWLCISPSTQESYEVPCILSKHYAPIRTAFQLVLSLPNGDTEIYSGYMQNKSIEEASTSTSSNTSSDYKQRLSLRNYDEQRANFQEARLYRHTEKWQENDWANSEAYIILNYNGRGDILVHIHGETDIFLEKKSGVRIDEPSRGVLVEKVDVYVENLGFDGFFELQVQPSLSARIYFPYAKMSIMLR